MTAPKDSIWRLLLIGAAVAGLSCGRAGPSLEGLDAAQPDSAHLDVPRPDYNPGETGATASLAAVAAIISPTCAIGGCHDPITKSHGMDLSNTEGIYAAWVDKLGIDHCDNRPRKRVVPGDPAGSFVMEKITATTPCDLSQRMPPPPWMMLSPDQIETIRAWIAAGAPPGAPSTDGGGDAGDDIVTDPDTDGGADAVDPSACSATNPCPSGSNCTADTCAGPWTCVAHFVDDTLEHPCAPEIIPFCGCDGVTFEASSTCPDRPWSHAGACDDGANCNYNFVSCSDPKPNCPEGQQASVVNDCYGPCVDISQCRCLYHWMCPNLSLYTCLESEYRCGPNPNLVDAGSDGAPVDGADAEADVLMRHLKGLRPMAHSGDHPPTVTFSVTLFRDGGLHRLGRHKDAK